MTPAPALAPYEFPAWATSQQREIIDHSVGHALVFAVAGSGKSTSLIERARRLNASGYRADQILLTTFSRDARQSLQDRLAAHGSPVKAMTLHALATLIVGEARKRGLTHLQIGPEHFSRRLLEEARKEALVRIGELGLDNEAATKLAAAVRAVGPEDFATYLGVEKGALRLPTVPTDIEPALEALVFAPEGEAAYVLLYTVHDELRQAHGWMDFDDVIVHAWMILGSCPELQGELARRWPQVMVDEFQDVSRAQAEMLHLLCGEAECYMAIGDDDQTVYQWRGASPEMILGFQSRYGARVLLLSDNWRCPMDVVALSAAVIRGNRIRANKEMRATTARMGVHLHESADPRAPGELIAELIEAGQDPEELAVLVRTYAQSAPIEEVLIERKIPYRLIGNVPFYTRQEVRVLLAYLDLARAEAQWAQGWRPDDAERARLTGLWVTVSGRPARYLRSAQVQEIARQAYLQDSLGGVLRRRAAALSGREAYLGKSLRELADWLGWLAQRLELRGGGAVLRQFAGHLKYAEHLIKTAPSREFGEERAASIEALCRMAQDQPLDGLSAHLRELEALALHLEKREDPGEDGRVPRVTLTSAFRAKGLEWDTVVVPGVSSEIYRPGKRGTPAQREEERRVLYVAMTRPRYALHLCYERGAASPFLVGAHHHTVVHDHSQIALMLARAEAPGLWKARANPALRALLQRYGHLENAGLWASAEMRAAAGS